MACETPMTSSCWTTIVGDFPPLLTIIKPSLTNIQIHHHVINDSYPLTTLINHYTHFLTTLINHINHINHDSPLLTHANRSSLVGPTIIPWVAAGLQGQLSRWKAQQGEQLVRLGIGPSGTSWGARARSERGGRWKDWIIGSDGLGWLPCSGWWLVDDCGGWFGGWFGGGWL